jgi:hypothetical protein
MVATARRRCHGAIHLMTKEGEGDHVVELLRSSWRGPKMIGGVGDGSSLDIVRRERGW